MALAAAAPVLSVDSSPASAGHSCSDWLDEHDRPGNKCNLVMYEKDTSQFKNVGGGRRNAGHGLEHLEETLQQLQKHPNALVYASLLQQCGNSRTLSSGRRIHAHLVQCGKHQDTLVANRLMHMYGRCGKLEDACRVFEELRKKNVFSWNIMLGAYAQTWHPWEARRMFERMPQRSVVSWNAMVAAYAQNGHLREARGMFDEMPCRGVVSWNAMISGYTDSGDGRNAVHVYWLMRLEGVQPDRITFITVLDACSGVAMLQIGRCIHSNVVESGLESEVSVGTALVDMYGKCRSLEDARIAFGSMPQQNVVSWTAMLAAYALNGHVQNAREFFDEMPYRNVVSWTAMITAYAQNGYGKDALQLFLNMDLEGVQPNRVTLVSALDACAGITALAEGRLIHLEIVDYGIPLDVVMGTALLNMYAKCSYLNHARSLFDTMPRRSVISWNSMISAYAQNGHGKMAFELFRLMHLESMQPDNNTFISILSTCSHAGLLANGLRHWHSLGVDFGIEPVLDHYVCMIDLLGRSGKLDMAKELISSMPFEPDTIAWTTFLGACKIYNDANRAASAAHQASKLQPRNAAPYLMLSNIYTATKQHSEFTG